jgi:integrase
MMAAGTGLRQAEAFAVQLADPEGAVVDFLSKTLRVQRQAQPKAGGGTTLGPLKTKSSYRSIPLAQVVIDAIDAHLATYPVRGDGLVFTDDDGLALNRNSFNRMWRVARRRAAEALSKRAANEPDQDAADHLQRLADRMSGVGFHDLRHWYASALIRAGLSVKVVSERLGHTDAAMTLNVYSHLWPDDEDRSRQAIDLALCAPIAPRQDRSEAAFDAFEKPVDL